MPREKLWIDNLSESCWDTVTTSRPSVGLIAVPGSCLRGGAYAPLMRQSQQEAELSSRLS